MDKNKDNGDKGNRDQTKIGQGTAQKISCYIFEYYTKQQKRESSEVSNAFLNPASINFREANFIKNELQKNIKLDTVQGKRK